MLVETFLLVVQVLMSFSRDRVQQLLVAGPDHVDVHVPASIEWVQLRDDATSKPYFWNRRTRATMWKPSQASESLPVSAHLISLRCLLSEAHRGEILGIPSPLLGCHLWQTCSVSACCLRRTLWLLGLVASVSCVLLARQWIQYVRQSSVATGCYFTHSSVKVGLGS